MDISSGRCVQSLRSGHFRQELTNDNGNYNGNDNGNDN